MRKGWRLIGLYLDSYEINSLSMLVMDTHSEIPPCFVNNDTVIILYRVSMLDCIIKHSIASGSLFSIVSYLLLVCLLHQMSLAHPPDVGHALAGPLFHLPLFSNTEVHQALAFLGFTSLAQIN